MAENSKSTVALLGIITVACLGGSAVLWASFRQSEANLQEGLRQSEMRATTMAIKFERLQKFAAENVKPSVQPESVVSEGELEVLTEKLRLASEDLNKSKLEAERYKGALEKYQKGMKAAAKLQGEMRADLTKEKNRTKELAAALDVIRVEKKKLQEALSKLRGLKEKIKEVELPKNLPIPGKGDSDSSHVPSIQSRAKLVVKQKTVQDEADTSLRDWVASILKAGPDKIAQLVRLAGDDPRIGTAVAEILNQADLTMAALAYMELAPWWTFDRIVARAGEGLPRSELSIERLGLLIHKKAQAESRTIADDEFSTGILGAAQLRYLATRPVHQVPITSFLKLMNTSDSDVAREASQALIDPRRRHEWISAVLDKRATGGAYPERLEAFVWEKLESSVASSVALARHDPSIAEKLRNRIPVWATDRSDDVVRRVAMETLQLFGTKKEAEHDKWQGTWGQVWPEFKAANTDLLSWLGQTSQDRRVMREVLASPSFGCANIDNALVASRSALAATVLKLSSIGGKGPALKTLWMEIIEQDQPLVIPLMVDGLSTAPQSTAMEIATRLMKIGNPAGEAWFRSSLDSDFDRRMATVERLFEIATPLAHEVAQSSIVGNGDPRTTYRVVELGWEEDVSMSSERIAQVLRSPFLDPIRLDVYMAYFERCLGDELPGMVAEALFDPSAERHETLLDYLSYCPDQRLLPLLSRYLESDRSQVRESALRSLVPLELADIIGDLLKLIADPEPMVKIQLARCLGSLSGDSVARGGLLVLCKDDSAFVREASYDAMATHVPEKLMPALRFGIRDEARDVAVAAAKTMIETGSPDDAAYDLLFKTVEDPWLGVSTMNFLKSKLGQEFKTRDEWRAWWATRGNK